MAAFVLAVEQRRGEDWHDHRMLVTDDQAAGFADSLLGEAQIGQER